MERARKTVMVIEDNFELRSMLAELLYEFGYSVFSAEDASDACDLARTVRPAAVLCDVILPTTNGFEAADRLERDPATRRIPVILMSGHSTLRERRPATQRWLMKPFTGEELTTALQSALQ